MRQSCSRLYDILLRSIPPVQACRKQSAASFSVSAAVLKSFSAESLCAPADFYQDLILKSSYPDKGKEAFRRVGYVYMQNGVFSKLEPMSS